MPSNALSKICAQINQNIAAPTLQSDEIQIELLLSCYVMTLTCLFSIDNRELYPAASRVVVVKMMNMGRVLCAEIGYVKETFILSLDDDLLRCLSKLVQSVGLLHK